MLLTFNFRAFSHVSEMYFYSINFTFFIWLFLVIFFFWELFWFYFTMKVTGGHVHTCDSLGKSSTLALTDSPVCDNQYTVLLSRAFAS